MLFNTRLVLSCFAVFSSVIAAPAVHIARQDAADVSSLLESLSDFVDRLTLTLNGPSSPGVIGVLPVRHPLPSSRKHCDPREDIMIPG